MNIKIIITLAVITAVIAGISVRLDTLSKSDDKPTIAGINAQISPKITKAEKVEVIHFHATEQCVSCIAVGRLAKQTIDEKFSDELKSGKILFKEINVDLPENNSIVQKYQARGSSLMIDATQDGKDNISEDVTVWGLINNEAQYKNYFENKLRNLLGS